MLYYIRDDAGSLVGMKYNDDLYYYIKNLQEDIIGIMDANFNKVATYEYDSWGKILSIKNSNGVEITDKNHIAHINPFRYRSYYYDADTGLYYLKTRYYNPEWGRFLNADSIIGTSEQSTGYNLFSYAENNPISFIDSDGEFALAIGAGIGVAKGLAAAGGLLLTYLAAKKTTEFIADVATNPPRLPETKPKEKPKKKEDTKKQNNEPTYIYRYGGTNPGNLRPSYNDFTSHTGLSFSTVPALGAAETTIEEINATGVLYAIKDGKYHVSVYPIGGTIDQWYNEGSSSIWTQTLKKVVRKWDGIVKW